MRSERSSPGLHLRRRGRTVPALQLVAGSRDATKDAAKLTSNRPFCRNSPLSSPKYPNSQNHPSHDAEQHNDNNHQVLSHVEMIAESGGIWGQGLGMWLRGKGYREGAMQGTEWLLVLYFVQSLRGIMDYPDRNLST